MGVDGKDTLMFDESLVRDGLRTTEGKDVGSKKDTQEAVQSREKGVQRGDRYWTLKLEERLL